MPRDGRLGGHGMMAAVHAVGLVTNSVAAAYAGLPGQVAAQWKDIKIICILALLVEMWGWATAQEPGQLPLWI